MSKLAIALSLTTIQAVTAWLDVMPSSPLFLGSARGLRRQRALDSLHDAFLLQSLYDDAWSVSPRISTRSYWPAYESLVPRFSSSPLEDLLQGGGRTRRYGLPRLRSLEQMLQGGLQGGNPLGARWVDKGEHLDAAVSLPRGFNVNEEASLSAELDTEGDAHKVTIKGSRPGMHFSRSLSLPFPASEGDVELEYQPAAGLLTLRLRKPADAPAPPTALPIKRVADEEDCEKLAPEGSAAAADAAEGERAAPEEVVPGATESQEERGEQQQVEQQEQLEEKFAFVKQAEAPKAAADPAAEEE